MEPTPWHRREGRRPRTYRFTVSYNTANTKREVIYRQQVQGLYTPGLPNGEVAWKNVTVADAVGPTAAFPPAQKRDFMEGFQYRNNVDSTMNLTSSRGSLPPWWSSAISSGTLR